MLRATLRSERLNTNGRRVKSTEARNGLAEYILHYRSPYKESTRRCRWSSNGQHHRLYKWPRSCSTTCRRRIWCTSCSPRPSTCRHRTRCTKPLPWSSTYRRRMLSSCASRRPSKCRRRSSRSSKLPRPNACLHRSRCMRTRSLRCMRPHDSWCSWRRGLRNTSLRRTTSKSWRFEPRPFRTRRRNRDRRRTGLWGHSSR